MTSPFLDSSPQSFVRRLLLAILLFQRKNGYIFSAWGKLRLIEHQLLIELDRSPLVRPVDLSILLSQPASNISHVLRSLRRRGFVREIEGNSNREKLLLLSTTGKSTTSSLDDLSNQLMYSLVENFKDPEQLQIYDLWEMMNDSLGSPRTVVRPGDHPLRIQTRRFTRVFGFLSKRPESSSLSFPEIHILYALKFSMGGIRLRDLAQMLNVPTSTLQKNLTKLHQSGLCSAPTERRGSTIQISEIGSELFEKILDGLTRKLLGSFSKSLMERVVDTVPVFERMIDAWKPSYTMPQLHYRVQSHRDFFLQLQTRHLTEYAQRFWGMMPWLVRKNDSALRYISILRGPTPCFHLAYHTHSDNVVVLEEFGCTPSTNWKEVTEPLLLELLSGRSDSERIELRTTSRTAPLRSLLAIDSACRLKVTFSDLPPSNY